MTAHVISLTFGNFTPVFYKEKNNHLQEHHYTNTVFLHKTTGISAESVGTLINKSTQMSMFLSRMLKSDFFILNDSFKFRNCYISKLLKFHRLFALIFKIQQRNFRIHQNNKYKCIWGLFFVCWFVRAGFCNSVLCALFFF